MSEANGEYPPVSGSAGRPDDGNWRMLSSREREYLAKLKSEARRADQLGVNCRWLVAQLDAIHAALCPGHIGTWQERAQAAVKAAQATTQNVTEQARCKASPASAGWRRCEWAESEQYRSRILTGSIGLEGTWDEWADGRPEKTAMNREYEYRRREHGA